MPSFLEQQMNEVSLLMEEHTKKSSVLPIVSSPSSTTSDNNNMPSYLEQQMNEASLLMEKQTKESSVLPVVSSASSITSDNDFEKEKDKYDRNDIINVIKDNTDRALEVTSFLEKQISEASMIVEGQYDDDSSEITEITHLSRCDELEGEDADESEVGSEHNTAVRDMANRLAPSMRELDFLLSQRSLGSAHSRMNHSIANSSKGDESSFTREIRDLEASEQLLHQELEFAHDFGSMLHMSGTNFSTENYQEIGTVMSDIDDEQDDKEYRKSNNVVAEEEAIHDSGENGSSKPFSATQYNYTLSDHLHYLQLQTEARGGWYYIPISFDSSSGREYIIPLPEQELSRLYVGLQSSAPLPSLSLDPTPKENSSRGANTKGAASRIGSERLPLRTVGFKLRSDVLVGAVIDAVQFALKEEPYSLEVKKRQGGHLILQGLVLEFDFQVVCYKGSGSRFCERTLLLRIFYLKQHEARAPPPNESHFMLMGDGGEYKDLRDNESNWTLREASALVQKTETSKKGSEKTFVFPGFWGKKRTYPNKRAMQDSITHQLLDHFKPCPSVDSGNLTLPSLSKDDWPWIQYTYRYMKATWDELDDRDLTYSSLQVSSFGQFPCLTTLDVHYISQLRRYSRENMVLSLLRSASELEQYAREAELTCTNLTQSLKTSFRAYKLDPPGIPQSLPLMAYPLDFTPPQALFPPWGQKITEALNEITKASAESHGAESFKRAENAVQLVLDAFQIQHDEEQSARLGRKNVQVMDRLAKMQAHKQVSIVKLLQSYNRSSAAKRAADEFRALAKKAKYGSDPLPDLPASDQVPLFKCSILVGGSTGSFFVTANHIMCATQLVPLLGGNRIKLVELRGLTFNVQGKERGSSLLNPLPVSLVARRDGKEVLTLRPSYSASRLKAFLEIIQAYSEDSKASYMTRHELLSIEENIHTDDEDEDEEDDETVSHHSDEKETEKNGI
eukprot:CAMPEP_0194141360 /NCGR_PEP_ID=MMETSP0152-20130528/10778_1 /TAXON_ID=1049557 /ORGANISM="Thalassiothrix antarctica, Strain L6-D1" /LENGTH=959 /DNA_ID=CAMNT_0038839957 /DNA_START=245 /DNA_END=3124 /DNA_ORIENTATION=-